MRVEFPGLVEQRALVAMTVMSRLGVYAHLESRLQRSLESAAFGVVL